MKHLRDELVREHVSLDAVALERIGR